MEQKLIDIMFEVGLMIKNHDHFRKLDNEQTAEWIRQQLKQCGIVVVEPCGASHGVLVRREKE